MKDEVRKIRDGENWTRDKETDGNEKESRKDKEK